MDTVLILIFVSAIAIGISVWYKSKLLGEGKIIERDRDFAEYAEIFTLRSVPFPEMAEIIQATDFKKNGRADISGTAGNLTLRTGAYYEAKLTCTEHNEGTMTYRFEFIHWKSSHGSPEFANEMNMLTTTVEKMFLGIDPNTQVSKVKNDIKTKRGLL
jgi:hypothetical protein